MQQRVLSATAGDLQAASDSSGGSGSSPSISSSTVQLGRLVLLSPFTRLVDIAKQMFPFIPGPVLNMLLRHKSVNP